MMFRGNPEVDIPIPAAPNMATATAAVPTVGVPTVATPTTVSAPVIPAVSNLPINVPEAVPVTPPTPTHTKPQSQSFSIEQQPSFVSNGEKVERDQKIVQALDAVKSELVSKGQELTREREWANAVEDMVSQYQAKLHNVHEHITKLHDEMKDLLVKKKQIENVEIQQQLKEKLSLAEVDMSTLNDALEHVRTQTEKFGNKRKELEQQIKTLEDQMVKLKGESKNKKKEKKEKNKETSSPSLVELEENTQDHELDNDQEPQPDEHTEADRQLIAKDIENDISEGIERMENEKRRRKRKKHSK
jgi:hypothetical protein